MKHRLSLSRSSSPIAALSLGKPAYGCAVNLNVPKQTLSRPLALGAFCFLHPTHPEIVVTLFGLASLQLGLAFWIHVLLKRVNQSDWRLGQYKNLAEKHAQQYIVLTQRIREPLKRLLNDTNACLNNMPQNHFEENGKMASIKTSGMQLMYELEKLPDPFGFDTDMQNGKHPNERSLLYDNTVHVSKDADTKPQAFDQKLAELMLNSDCDEIFKIVGNLQNRSHSTREVQFLQNVCKAIRENITDPDFSTAKLCKQLALSNSKLHRMLMEFTDKTPVQLIRSIRMTKARYLLKTSDLSIAEVAVESGFKDPAYFARIFSKEFGISPSEYRNSQHIETLVQS